MKKVRLTPHRNARFSSLVHELLTVIIWNKDQPLWFQYLTTIVSQAQITLTLLWIQLNYLFEIESEFLIKLFQFFCKVPVLNEDLNGNSTGNYLIEYGFIFVGIYFIGLLFIWFVLLRLAFRATSKLGEKTKPIITYWAQIHHDVLFWFIDVTLSYTLSDNSNTLIAKNPTIATLITTISVILFIFNYGVGALCVLFSFDPFRNNNRFSCSKPTFQLLTFLSKGLISSLIFFLSGSKAFKHILFSVSLALFILRHYMLVRTYPYFNYSAMKLIGLFSTSSMFLAISNCVIFYLPFDFKGSKPSTLFFQFFFLLMSFKIFLNSLESTILFYLKKQPQELKTYDQVQKKLFSIFYILQNTKILIDDGKTLLNNRLFLYLLTAIRKYREHNRIDAQTKINDDNDLEIGLKLKQIYSEYLFEMAVKTLTLAIERNLKCRNKLKLELAHIIFAKKNLYPKAIFLLTSVKKHPNNLQEAVKVHKYTQYVQNSLLDFFEKKGEEGVLDAKRAVDLETSLSAFLDDIINDIEKFVKLWRLYLEPDFTLREFIKQSSNFEKHAERIEKTWNHLNTKYGKLLTNLYPLYSAYLALIRNAFYSSAKLNEKYYANREVIVKENDASPLLPESLLGLRNMHFQVLMSRENIGKVIYCSKNVTHEIGWSPEDVIGKDIVFIMPPYMQDKHHDILVSNLENLPAKFFSTYIKSFVRTNEGFLKPSTTIATVYPYIKEDLVYFGIIKTHNFIHESIILDERGHIDSFTKQIANQLGLPVSEKRVHIKNICPLFESKLRQALKNCRIDEPEVFPLSKCIESIGKIVREDEEALERVQGEVKLKTSQPFVLKLPFICRNDENVKRYIVSFEVRHILQASITVMNLFEDKNEDFSSATKVELNLFREEEEEYDIGDQEDMDEVIENEMTEKYMSHATFSLKKGKRFSLKTAKSREKKMNSKNSLQINSINSEVLQDNALSNTLEEVLSLSKRNQNPCLSFSQTSRYNDYGSSRRQEYGHSFTFSTEVGQIPLQSQSPEQIPIKNLHIKHKPRQMSMFSLINASNNSFMRSGDRRKVGTMPVKIESSNIKTDAQAKPWVPKIDKANNRAIARWFSSSHYTSSLSSKSRIKKLEQALYYTSRDTLSEKFSFAIKIFVLICGVLLLSSYVDTLHQLKIVYDQIDISKASRDRLQASLHLYTTIEFLELLSKDFIPHQTQSPTNDMVEVKKSQAKAATIDLQETNKRLNDLVSVADKDLQDQIHKRSTYKSYGNENQQVVRGTVELNDFNAIEEIINIGLRISKEGLENFNKENSSIFTFFGDLLMNLLASEISLNNIIHSNCTQRISSIATGPIFLMSVTGGLGILIFFFFFFLERQVIIKRNQIINGFLCLDEDLISEHVNKVRTFYAGLQQDLFDINLYFNTNKSVKASETRIKVKGGNQKKKAVLNGVDSLPTKLALLVAILTLMLSGFLLQFLLANSFQKKLTDQVKQYFLLDEYHYKTDLLEVYFYSLVLHDDRNALTNQPLEQEWEKLYQDLQSAGNYFFNIIYKHDNNWLPEQEERLKDLIQGDLCNIGIDDLQMASCSEIADGSFTRGIVGLNSFILSALRQAKDQFMFSLRTSEAIREIFSRKEFSTNQQIKEPSLTLVYQTLETTLKRFMNVFIEDFVKLKLWAVTISVAIYIIIGLLFLSKVMKVAQNERDIWRKLFRQIPYPVLRSNKLLYRFLIKNSNESYVYFEN